MACCRFLESNMEGLAGILEEYTVHLIRMQIANGESIRRFTAYSSIDWFKLKTEILKPLIPHIPG